MIENYGEDRLAGIGVIVIFGTILWFLGALPAIFRWLVKTVKGLPGSIKKVGKKDLILSILTLGIYPLMELSDRWARWAPPGEFEKEALEKNRELAATASPREREKESDNYADLTILFFTISGLILLFTEFPIFGWRGPGNAFATLTVALLRMSLVPGLISFVISRAWKKNFWFILSIFFLIQSVLQLVGSYILEPMISKEINEMLLEDLYK